MIVSQQALNLAIQIRGCCYGITLASIVFVSTLGLASIAACVHTTLPLQATHFDIPILPLAWHLLGQSRLPARSVLLPLAEVSAGHPHP